MKRIPDIKSRIAAAQMHALAAVRNEIRHRDPARDCKYLREFNHAYRKYDRLLNRDEFRDRLTSASLIMVGDYHALPSAQNFATMLLEQVAQGSRVVLGVEAVLSRDQHILDAWWRREIGETTLRERLRFDREWGYDWQPFYDLLLSARDHADGIYGLDCVPRDDLRCIRSRDRHAAAKIGQIRESHRDAVVIVLFGEAHLAPQHLPPLVRRLLPEERTITVLQNLDALYWRALNDGAYAVELGNEQVCVFNSSPLEKYESYRLCLEKWNAAVEGSATDEAPDYAPVIYNLIFSLARSLGFRLDSPRNGTQPKSLRDLLPEVISLRDEPEDCGIEQPGESSCSYIAETNTMFIREFNMFSAAREAARFLHCACCASIGKTRAKNSQDQDTEEELAHFGARLLCPGITDRAWVANTAGEALYQKYLAGGISRAEVRRMFLAHS